MAADVSPSSQQRFRDLYENYYVRIYAYCRRRTDADSVDDAVGEVFLTVWRRIESVPVEADEQLAWLYRVAHLTLANHWRRRRRRSNLKSKLNSIRAEFAHIPEDVVVMSDEMTDAVRAADRLKPADREILRLSVWEELTTEQIAAVLNIERNAVSQRLYRAKARLTREYQKITRSEPTPINDPQGDWL